MLAPIVKAKISKYLGLEDMEEKLAPSNNRVVHMSEKHDRHYVAIYNDGVCIRLRSSGGHLLKYCLGQDAIPSLLPGVELRAELVLEKATANSSYEQFLNTNAMFSHVYLVSNALNPFDDFRDLMAWDWCDDYKVPCKILLHVHWMVDHGHDLNTAQVARYLEGHREHPAD